MSRTVPFTPEEDAKLRYLLNLHRGSTTMWELISDHIRRTMWECKARERDGIFGTIKFDNFSLSTAAASILSPYVHHSISSVANEKWFLPTSYSEADRTHVFTAEEDALLHYLDECYGAKGAAKWKELASLQLGVSQHCIKQRWSSFGRRCGACNQWGHGRNSNLCSQANRGPGRKRKHPLIDASLMATVENLDSGSGAGSFEFGVHMINRSSTSSPSSLRTSPSVSELSSAEVELEAAKAIMMFAQS